MGLCYKRGGWVDKRTGSEKTPSPTQGKKKGYNNFEEEFSPTARIKLVANRKSAESRDGTVVVEQIGIGGGNWAFDMNSDEFLRE